MLNEYYTNLIESIHDNVIELRADMDMTSEEIAEIHPTMVKRLNSILWDLAEFKQGDSDFE